MLAVTAHETQSSRSPLQESLTLLYRQLALCLDALNDLSLAALPLDEQACAVVLVDDLSDLLQEIAVCLCNSDGDAKAPLLWELDSRATTVVEEVRRFIELQSVLH